MGNYPFIQMYGLKILILMSVKAIIFTAFTADHKSKNYNKKLIIFTAFTTVKPN
jgi:hypothetical protein